MNPGAAGTVDFYWVRVSRKVDGQHGSKPRVVPKFGKHLRQNHFLLYPSLHNYNLEETRFFFPSAHLPTTAQYPPINLFQEAVYLPSTTHMHTRVHTHLHGHSACSSSHTSGHRKILPILTPIKATG